MDAGKKRFSFVIDEQSVRGLLGEHEAPFPKIMFVSPKDRRLRDGSGHPALGMFYYPGSDNSCEIYLQSGAFGSKTRLLNVIIHELCHWRDTFDNNSQSDQLGFCGALFLLYRGFWAIVGLYLFVFGCFINPAVAFLFGVSFLLFVLDFMIWGMRFIRQLVETGGLRHLNVCGRALLGSYDHRWRKAVKIRKLKNGE